MKIGRRAAVDSSSMSFFLPRLYAIYRFGSMRQLDFAYSTTFSYEHITNQFFVDTIRSFNFSHQIGKIQKLYFSLLYTVRQLAQFVENSRFNELDQLNPFPCINGASYRTVLIIREFSLLLLCS